MFRTLDKNAIIVTLIAKLENVSSCQKSCKLVPFPNDLPYIAKENVAKLGGAIRQKVSFF
jgi:hypothetical protein